MTEPKRILVPLDFSEQSLRAGRQSGDLIENTVRLNVENVVSEIR